MISMSKTMKSIAVIMYFRGNRPPPIGCGVGSMPHSYASSLARLNRRGPTIGAIATQNTANAAARANSPTIGTYGDSDTAADVLPSYQMGLSTLFRVTAGLYRRARCG